MSTPIEKAGTAAWLDRLYKKDAEIITTVEPVTVAAPGKTEEKMPAQKGLPVYKFND